MGLFVTFEGPEGSGKSTQIRLLYEALRERAVPVICTREPGGTAIGEQIRSVLHDVGNTAMSPRAEVLLYSAARAQLVDQVIRPALERGEIVLSDRFAESTLAYQGYGRGLDLDSLVSITNFATKDTRPDLIIYLDLDVEIGLGRKLRDQQAGRGELNRMDRQAIDFHRRVREGYLDMARRDPARWLIIDATQPIEVIHQTITERVIARCRDSRGA